MDSKTFLKDYANINATIDAHMAQLDVNAGRLKHVRVLHGDAGFMTVKLENEIQSLIDQIRADVATLSERRDAIKTALDKISDENGRLILYYRYCQGMTETETAAKLGYKNRSYITKATPALLDELTEILNAGN